MLDSLLGYTIFASNFTVSDIIKHIFDFLILFICIFIILKILLSHERSRDLVKGIVVVAIFLIINYYTQLPFLTLVIDKLEPWYVLIIFIVFQPEIRSFVSKIGKYTSSNTRTSHFDKKNESIDELQKAIKFMASKKIGALITIQKNDKLDEFLSRQTELDSQITFELITTLFVHNSPLHDGAVIVANNRVSYAGAMLPTTTRENIDKDLGSRHRAGLGISEVSDSVTIIVSEQTGYISITHKGNIRRNVTIEEVKFELLKNI